MDYTWATAKVEQYIALLRSAESAFNDLNRSMNPSLWRERDAAVDAKTLTIEQIANEVSPRFVDGLTTRDVGTYAFPFTTRLRSANLLLGALRDHDEVAEHLGLTGPKLAATEMHPWVWEEAASRWDAGFFRDAVQAAATRIFDVELPKKLGVMPSKDPANLFAAFAPDKNSGTVLRFSDIDPADPSWASIHRGTMLVGQGCIMSIRNPRTHRLEIPEDQAALEELATLSLLSRWIDESVAQSVSESAEK